MPQLTIYVDARTIERVGAAAKAAHCSVSRWVRDTLVDAIERGWPPGYFDLFGSLAETDFERPEQPALDHDHKRKSI